MAYSAPSISASGQSFATLQTLGAHGYIQGLAIADSASVNQTTLIDKLLHKVQCAQVVSRLSNIVDGYLHGDPVAVATVDTELQDLSFAFKAVATAIDEIGALVDANPGSLAYTAATTGIGMSKQTRTFS